MAGSGPHPSRCILEGDRERSITRTWVLWLPVCCGVFFQLREQEPCSPCGCLLLPHGLGDAASSAGFLAPSGAVLRLLPLPVLVWPAHGRWALAKPPLSKGLRLLFSLALGREEEAEGLQR